jgi:phage shock protein C
MSAEARGAQLPPPATAEPEAREADVAAARRLYRSRTDRMFAGVCGGIAETYGSDPTAVRLLTAVIGIVTGIIPMLIVYLVAAVVIPERTSDDLPTGVARAPILAPGRGAIVVGVVLIVAGVAALGNEVLNVDWDVVWPIALIAFGGVIVTAAWRR